MSSIIPDGKNNSMIILFITNKLLQSFRPHKTDVLFMRVCKIMTALSEAEITEQAFVLMK